MTERLSTGFPSFSLLFQGLMQSCNQMHASYLFQQDKHYDLSYDTGDKALQCGRHVDVFKLWLMWRAKVSTLELAEWQLKTDAALSGDPCEDMANIDFQIENYFLKTKFPES